MKKWIVIGVIGLILIISGGIAFYLLSLPPKETMSKAAKEEAVTKLLGRKAQLDADNIPQGNTEYTGKYVSFTYPAKALIYEYKDPSFASNSSRLEDFSFDIKEPKIVFNMQIISNSSQIATIDDHPSVKLRDLRSYEYKKSDITAGNMKGRAFYKKENGAEKTGFVLNKDKIFSISITGTSSDEVEKLFDAVISTVKFK